MTPNVHANTVRDFLALAGMSARQRDALRALDALQTQAERNLVTEALARNAQVHIDGALKDRQRAEAAEAERDHARDALRRFVDSYDASVDGYEMLVIARAVLSAREEQK